MLPDWDELFMTAALQPELWYSALDTMADSLGASHGQLIGVGRSRNIPFNLVTNFDTAQFAEFVAIGGGSPDFNHRIAASAHYVAKGLYDPILYEDHYDEMLPKLASQQYVEWCDAVDIPFGCQTNLVIDDHGLIGFATLRSRRDGPTTPLQRRVFAQAANAARRAVRLQERLEGEQTRFLHGAFEAVSICAFIIDRRGQLLAHTSRADDLLAEGRIRITGRELDAKGVPIGLRQGIAALCAENGLLHVRLKLEDTPDKCAPPVIIEGFRLPPKSLSLGRSAHAVLIGNPPKRDKAGLGQFLTALYGLTRAEADIALRLADGTDRQSIAAIRGVSSETLRGQIKTIHNKCGVQNEAGLMRLMRAIVA